MCSLKDIFKISTILMVIRVVQTKTYRLDDICGEFNGRRMYLELGEEGTLIAKKVNGLKNITRILNKEVSSNRECGLELITCPSCVITLKFTFLNLSRSCGNASVLDTCGCDYVWIYEPPFEDVSGKQFCGHFLETNSSLLYRSQTRVVAVIFMNVNNHDHAFTLDYFSERNRRLLHGSPKLTSTTNASQIITSPFFPCLYPRDLSMEYVINCTMSDTCRIRLIFTDFQIAATSFIEFFDWNGQRMYVTTGSLFRPPIVFSTGPTLVIRFYANGGTNIGYKAKYTFLEDETDKAILNIDGDCGGYVDNLGGGITMMNMVKDGVKAFDCFWIIKPPETFVHLKTHLYLKVVKFLDFAGSTELLIRQGSTSNEALLETFRYPLSHFHILKEKEHIIPISQGFYVSLRGIFNTNSSLAIMYSAFNYKECYSASDFLCQNHRCIPSYLSCDGYDHCGDNSDEQLNCKLDSKDRKWVHRSNFYFPKLDRDADLRTATLVFIVCSVGLVALIFALIGLLYRVNTRARNQIQIQTHLQTINDLIEEGSQRIVEEIIVNDEPPNYEAPPEYNDIMNIIRKKENQRGRSTRSSEFKRTSHSRRRACSRCAMQWQNRDMCGPEETGESSVPSEASSVVNFQFEERNRSCQTTPLPISVPESPPPPYVAIRTVNSENEEPPVHLKEDYNLEIPSCSSYTSGNCETTIKSDKTTLKNWIFKDTVISYRRMAYRKSNQQNQQVAASSIYHQYTSFSDSELNWSEYMNEDKHRKDVVKMNKYRKSVSNENLFL